MIQFTHVHKWFGKLHVLNDINLTVSAGEVAVRRLSGAAAQRARGAGRDFPGPRESPV